jgi:hypothetical protein
MLVFTFEIKFALINFMDSLAIFNHDDRLAYFEKYNLSNLDNPSQPRFAKSKASWNYQ